MNKNIVLLASYPKSGNTWFRLFLNALLCDLDQIDINDLPLQIPIISDKTTFHQLTGLNPEDLTMEEINQIRPGFHRCLNQTKNGARFFKVHDANLKVSPHEYLFPTDCIKSVIYFIRNPLDVCISFAHHYGSCDYEKKLEELNGERTSLCHETDHFNNQLPQQLGSWANHVTGWLDETRFPVHCMKYEDMLSNPLETFKTAIAFLGLSKSNEEINKALDLCSFENLKAKESETGFRERHPKAERFFISGQTGQWHGKVSNESVKRYLSSNQNILKRLGYLNSKNQQLIPYSHD